MSARERNPKITVRIPVGLLQKAKAVTGKGTADTLQMALDELVLNRAYEAVRNMRGKVQFSIDLNALRDEGPFF